MKPSKPTYTLTLEALPDRTDPDGTRRLRLALKALLRCWRLKCVEIRPAEKAEKGKGVA